MRFAAKKKTLSALITHLEKNKVKQNTARQTKTRGGGREGKQGNGIREGREAATSAKVCAGMRREEAQEVIELKWCFCGP